jgi:hypothetical protein
MLSQNLIIQRYKQLERSALYFKQNLQVMKITRKITAHSKLNPDLAPVAFFNASTRLKGLSLNAAFSFLTALALQLSGTPVVHFACRSGMSRCVLGTNREDPSVLPPCQDCVRQSRWLYANSPAVWFKYRSDETLTKTLKDLDVLALVDFEFQGMPLGSLVLPSARWALRRHDLKEDEPTRFLLREYILSAYSTALEFERFIDQVQPQALVLFNGMMFPEAAARWTAEKRNIRVITHEVGMQPLTGFFTDGDATAYPIDILDDFELSLEKEARLDDYLEQRFKGRFTMAGIQFWPEMTGLSDAFLEKAACFKQIVPVFTNVIFDTSQPHANQVFEDMFSWLENVLDIIRCHPDTLFVIRAHPDEMRPGKKSCQPVSEWASLRKIDELPNAIFIPSEDYLSSYELIQRSKFIMVYNSSIGLEASIMGVPVLCAGKARYTQIPTVFFPQSIGDYQDKAEEFLAALELETPREFIHNSRRFLYYQLFKTSLPFDEYLEAHPKTPGFVRLRSFHWQRLTPEVSPTVRVLLDGILLGKPFVLEDKEGDHAAIS